MSKHGEVNHATADAGHKEPQAPAAKATRGRQDGGAAVNRSGIGEINPAVGFRVPKGVPDESHKPAGGVEINPAVGAGRSEDQSSDVHKPT